MFAFLFLLLVLPLAAAGQLPPEAVELAKVKISEAQKSSDLCPVYLVPSAAEGPTWEHQGVQYRGAKPDAKTKFLADPARFAAAAQKQRYINNFMLAMSGIWCPITDEVTPGGRKQVKGLGYTWESCCSFCDEEMTEDNFHDAVDRLRKRAEQAYSLGGGKYTEGAKSPVEGAIKDGR